jgi:hydroxypyruvate isomerase
MKFSANLGFLWTDRPLPDAIRAAHAAGFDAVECHWPYDHDVADVKSALDETGLVMLGLNTSRGDVAKGENGLAALVGRDADARSAIDQALGYAAIIETPNIHVMCGFAQGPLANETFVSNLKYACARAAELGKTILIEPLNHYDAPGYFLNTTTQAMGIIAEVGAKNIRLMFDCYHVQLMEGDVTNRIKRLLPFIGHIQFASVPDRGAPDHGEINYSYVFQYINEIGYHAPLGAEYKPMIDTDATLGWLQQYRK